MGIKALLSAKIGVKLQGKLIPELEGVAPPVDCSWLWDDGSALLWDDGSSKVLYCGTEATPPEGAWLWDDGSALLWDDGSSKVLYNG